MLLLVGMEDEMRATKHTHDWAPNEDGHYDCACGAVKGMSAEDAKKLWGEEPTK
jgi:hypothetical protein